MSTLSQFTAGGIKSVQRGTITFSAAANTAIATISSVNVNKSFVNFLGLSTDTTDSRFYETRLALTSGTQVSAARGVTSVNAPIVSYEVIEFY